MKETNKKDTRGGSREGSGRKPKADELKLIERLDNLIEQDEVLAQLKAQALGYELEKVNADGELVTVTIPGDLKAVTLYMQYRYGKPRETKEISINAELPLFNIDED